VFLLLAYSVAVIQLGTSRNAVVSADSIITSDKVLHGLVFGGLGVLAYLASGAVFPLRSRGFHCVAGILWGTGFGGLLEALQATLSYRSAEFLDLVADFIGATFFVALAAALRIERSLSWRRT
jgi:VanZ family protein